MSDLTCPDCGQAFSNQKARSGHMGQCPTRYGSARGRATMPVGLRQRSANTAPIVADGDDPRLIAHDPLIDRLGLGTVRHAHRSENYRIAMDAYDIVLDSPTEQRAFRAMRRAWLIGDQAEVEAWETFLTRCNIRLVLKIALAYEGRACTADDLVQFGAIGLLNAIRRFDPDRGLRFSTMATYWIRQQIGRGLHNDDRLIRLPVPVIEAILAMRRGREKKRVIRVSRQALEFWNHDAHSLDKPLDDERSPLGALIPFAGEVASEAEDAVIRAAILDAIASLDERERFVIAHRFGFDGCEMLTLDAVGKQLGISRERTRQIERNALAALRTALEHLRVQPLDAETDEEEELAYAAD